MFLLMFLMQSRQQLDTGWWGQCGWSFTATIRKWSSCCWMETSCDAENNNCYCSFCHDDDNMLKIHTNSHSSLDAVRVRMGGVEFGGVIMFKLCQGAVLYRLAADPNINSSSDSSINSLQVIVEQITDQREKIQTVQSEWPPQSKPLWQSGDFRFCRHRKQWVCHDHISV